MKASLKVIELGKIAEVQSGGTPSRVKSDYWSGDIPWYSSGELNSIFTVEPERKISSLGLLNSNAKTFPVGSLLIGMYDTAALKMSILDREAAFNQAIAGVRPNKNLELPFVKYAIESNRQFILDQRRGVRQKNLNLQKIKSIEIPAWSLPEQRRIVAILDEAFAGLDAMRANAEKNLRNARDLFDSHLNTVFSEKGEGWVETTLAGVSIQFGRGKSRHRPRNDPRLYGGKYPFIQTGDVRNCDHIITESTQTYNDAGLAQSKIWPKGTICITIAANIAETGILGFDACFPDSVIGMVVDERKTTSSYVEFLLQSMKAKLQSLGKGSAQANINLATFENQLFPFPHLDSQREIVGRLASLSEQVRQLETLNTQKLAAIAELKQSILQKAFAGELTSSDSAAA